MAIFLASGSVDRLLPFSTLVSGAVAMEYEVHVFASFWGLDAFRKERATPHPPMGPGHAEEGEKLAKTLVDRRVPGWRQMLATAKSLGPVHVYACAQSMDLYGLKPGDLDPTVDEVLGIAAFIDRAQGAEATYFI